MSPLSTALCASIAWLALHVALYCLLNRHYRRQAERSLAARRRRERYLKPAPWC